MPTFEELQTLNERLKASSGPLFVPSSPWAAAWLQHRDEVRQRWHARRKARAASAPESEEGK